MKAVHNPNTTLSPKRRLQMIYQSMKRRCHVPGTQHYENYGGRGITVCAEWLAQPELFIAWALSTWAPGLELDREDNNGPYAEWNCRWVSSSVQSRNRNNNTWMVYRGVRTKLIDAVEEAFPTETLRMLNLIHRRLSRGMSVEAAFTTPIRGQRK